MRNWRSVRIFTSDAAPSQHWYFEMLHRIVRPWLQANQAVDYCFSVYSVYVPGDPPAPNLAALPPGFIIQLPRGIQVHRSIRIRFVEPTPLVVVGQAPVVPAPTPIETSLRNIIALDPAHFWQEAVESFSIGNGFGDDRFSAFSVHQTAERETRGETIARIFKANCDLVMASFDYNNGNIIIETSSHQENQIMRTPFQSVGHMLADVWWTDNKAPVDVRAIDHTKGVMAKI